MSASDTASARMPGSTPVAVVHHLTVLACDDHRLAVRGLPADRTERLSLVVRLRDLLTAIEHADDVDREGSGALWVRYARCAFPAWQDEVTVELAEPER